MDIINLNKSFKNHKKQVLHGWRNPTLEYPIFIESKNNTIFDHKGNKYLDLDSQALVNILGFGIKEIAEMIRSQLKSIYYISPMHGDTIPEIVYASSLLELLGSNFQKIHFCLSGSMAVETAIKVARLVTGKSIILSFKDAFHGVSHAALASAGMDDIKVPFRSYDPKHVIIERPNCQVCSNNKYEKCNYICIDSILKIIDKIGDKSIAAIISEPFNSNLCIIPKKNFWQKLKNELDKRSILLIGDEISTGFGRTGKLFAFKHWKVVPDIILFGKNLTSGYLPISSVIISKQVAKQFEGNIFKHGTTFEGHALCCSAGLACLNICKKIDWLNLAKKASSRLRTVLNKINFNILTQVRDVRVFGLLSIIELNDQIAEEVKSECREKGLLIGGFFNYLRISPAINIKTEELFLGANLLYKIIKKYN